MAARVIAELMEANSEARYVVLGAILMADTGCGCDRLCMYSCITEPKQRQRLSGAL
jgi:hypothetical protein